jgi:hypothetical protein
LFDSGLTYVVNISFGSVIIVFSTFLSLFSAFTICVSFLANSFSLFANFSLVLAPQYHAQYSLFDFIIQESI